MVFTKGHPYYPSSYVRTESIRNKLASYRLGKHHTVETKAKIGQAHLGHAFYGTLAGIEKMKKSLTGRKQPDKVKIKISQSNRISCNTLEHKIKMREIRSKQILPVKDTSIEVIVQNYLINRQVKFEKHKSFKVGVSYHQVDIYVSTVKTAIECDGDYWHSRPGSIEKDKQIDLALAEQGVNVIRLSEHNIRSGEFVNDLEGVW